MKMMNSTTSDSKLFDGKTVYLIIIIVLLVLWFWTLYLYADQMEDNKKMEDDINESLEYYVTLDEEVLDLGMEIDLLVKDNMKLTKINNRLMESANGITNKDTIRYLMKIAAKNYDIDPYLLLAISRYETGNWESVLCTAHNNFGGLRRGNGEWAEYQTQMQGINAMCRTLNGMLIMIWKLLRKWLTHIAQTELMGG